MLRCGDDVVAGSAAIIDYLERRFPEPRLYPRDDATLRRAISVQARFDEEVGPAIRLAMFHDLLLDPAYFVSMFTSGQPLLARVGYRAIFPVVSVLMTPPDEHHRRERRGGAGEDPAGPRLRSRGESRDRLSRRRLVQRGRPRRGVH